MPAPITLIDKCPETLLIKCYHRGHWADPYAESFAATPSHQWEDTTPTHLHIYKPNQFIEAVLGNHIAIPASIQTFSLPSPE